MSNRFTLHLGDCLETLRGMADNSVDAVVTDPPYGLSFMGKRWDYDVPPVEVWAECLRVLKPGGHLLAFAGTRTQHRMAVRIEDAGFEIRDMIAWVYGSGFPKSLDVSKAIDKAAPRTGMFEAFAKHYAEQRKSKGLTHSAICEAGKFYENQNHGGASVNWEKGYNVPTSSQWKVLQPLLDLSLEWLPLIERIEAEREVVAKQRGNLLAVAPGQDNDRSATTLAITAPATEAARQWQGWGTALKPALEPITVARKPLAGTVAANVLEHGTGALNIDGCRVPTEDDTARPFGVMTSKGLPGGGFGAHERLGNRPIVGVGAGHDAGRWPANLIHDGSDEVLQVLPAAPGQKADLSTTAPSAKLSTVYAGGTMPRVGESSQDTRYTEAGGTSFAMLPGARRLDTGSAARFFYCAKASRADRNEGTDTLPQRVGGMVSNTSGQHITRRDEGYEAKPQGNHHPTVKPTDLMAYLVRLVTPPGGIVLDPFMGSGSTGKAAMREGMRFIGCELSEDYVAIATARIQYEAYVVDEARRAAAEAAAPAPQLDLFSV